jgi:predicted phosphodiesterase
VSSRFGVIGDIHGNFAALTRILSRHPEIPFWLCVGDLATQTGLYPVPTAPLYFIQGNNESFDRLAVAAKRLRKVDVLLTHEAPKPFWIDLPSSTSPSRKWRRDVGKEAIAEVADALEPRLHCFGHHHVHAHFDRNGIPTICVDRVNRSYLLVDSESFAWQVLPTGD